MKTAARIAAVITASTPGPVVAGGRGESYASISGGGCMSSLGGVSRRTFLTGSGLALFGLTLQGDEQATHPEPIIDIHQHLNYSGRSDASLLTHQRVMGATMTILLPAGRSVKTASPHAGVAKGPEGEALGNGACRQV